MNNDERLRQNEFAAKLVKLLSAEYPELTEKVCEDALEWFENDLDLGVKVLKMFSSSYPDEMNRVKPKIQSLLREIIYERKNYSGIRNSGIFDYLEQSTWITPVEGGYQD